jgi:hypothetical protein
MAGLTAEATAIGYSLQSQIPGHEMYDNKGLEFQMNVKDKRRNIPHSSG